MKKTAKTGAIIVAAGKGARFGSERPKQYHELKGRPVLAQAIAAFEECDAIDEIVLVVSTDWAVFCEDEIIKKNNFSKIKKIVPGGAERHFSVLNGLAALSEGIEIVLVHDGARPFIDQDTIRRVIDGAKSAGACIAAVPVSDTIKLRDANLADFTSKTIPRDTLMAAQTPQGFERALLTRALHFVSENNIPVTDDAAAVEALGEKTLLVAGDKRNIKITTELDLKWGEIFEAD